LGGTTEKTTDKFKNLKSIEKDVCVPVRGAAGRLGPKTFNAGGGGIRNDGFSATKVRRSILNDEEKKAGRVPARKWKMGEERGKGGLDT